MEQAVQDAVGDGGLADDGMPVFDRTLAGDDGGSFLIAVLDDFQQIIALRIIEGSQKQVIDDEQLDLGQAGQHFEMGAVGFGLEQHFEQPWSAQIEHGMTLAGGEVAKRTGKITLAHPGGACEEHRVVTADPIGGGEFQDRLFV